MPASAILGTSISTGHGCFPPKPVIQGSPNVYAEGKQVVRVSDAWAVHCCTSYPYPCHASVSSQGSPNVFANGLSKARIGDAISCGDFVQTGASTVYING